MTSTVLDVGIALVLISAAVLTVSTATPPPRESDGRADETLETLSTTTATVNYSFMLDVRRADRRETFPVTSGPEFERTARGTLVSLLARAATRNVTVEGSRLSHTSDDYVRSVEEAVRAAVGGDRTRVDVRWRPYPGSSVEGHVAVGATPPATTDVHVASVTVPSGVREVDATRTTRETQRFDDVATAVAAGVVDGLFPPDRMRHSVSSDYPTSAVARYRYRRMGALTGTPVGPTLEQSGVSAANERLQRQLEPTVVRELRNRFETPRDAVRAVRVGRVTVTVRTWSA